LPLGGIAAVVACVAYIIAAVDAFWSGH
jgi:hypothetical protein